MAQPANSMEALMQILSLFQGKSQTEETSGSTTTKTTSQEGLNAMLKQALESNQGLASVMGGEKSAGLYNSSTNALLSNDLSSRLAAQIAANNSTTTVSPSTKTVSSPAAINKGNVAGLAAAVGGGTALNKIMAALGSDEGKAVTGLGKVALDKDAQKYMGKGYDAVSNWLGSMGSVDTQTEALGNIGGNLGEMAAPFFSNESAVQAASSVLSPTGADFMLQDSAPQFQSLMNAMQGIDLGGASGLVSDAAEVAAPVAADTAQAAGDTAANFLTASASGTTTSTLAPSSSGNVGSLAEAAPSSVISSLTAMPQAADQVSTAYEAAAGFDALSPNIGNSALELGGDYTSAFGAESAVADFGLEGAGSLDTAYDLGSGLSEAGGAADTLGGASGSGLSSAGSILGYVGPIMNAIFAENNPKGEQNPDYRKAVGGAILNYFQLGFLTPVVDAIAKPILNEAMEAGTKSMGTLGAVLADPIGAPLSGQYDVGELVSSTLDPANIFGGNKGGSVGATVAVGIDPVGAALGGEGLFGVVSDSVNSIDSSLSDIGDSIGLGDAPGRVVCTELTLAGYIPVEKYREVIKPDVTLTGRILLGYHVLGVPAVRKLRRDPKFVKRALPYVNAYLDHKLGKWNWRGFLIKSIGEPLCWMLSFVNRDPEAYKTLYPYRRNRNGT